MFDIANLSLGAVILMLRIAVVFLLYFFLWQVLKVVSLDLHRGSVAAPDQGNKLGHLLVMSSGQTGLPVGKTFALNPVTIIGRSMETDIALNDDFLSTQHARLEWREAENAWVLEDMGSTNGTFVNGFEVRDATSIKDGDVIRIGRIELKLVR
jgi:pSer/pThr/pTyr-binding forkhead associated (FHA) protein